MATNPSNPDGGKSGKKLPNFYEAMGGAYSGGEPKPGAGGGSAPSQEKQQSAVTLLQVVQKMERMETDAANKDLLQQIVQLVQQYSDKISGKSSPAAGTGTGNTPAPPPDSAQAQPQPPAPPAAGAGMGM